MDIAGAFFREVVALVGYALLVAAVYKLFQISADLGEIKELLKRRSSTLSSLPESNGAVSSLSASMSGLSGPSARAAVDLGPDDAAATEYAEQLMRAINAQSVQRTGHVELSQPGNRDAH